MNDRLDFVEWGLNKLRAKETVLLANREDCEALIAKDACEIIRVISDIE